MTALSSVVGIAFAGGIVSVDTPEKLWLRFSAQARKIPLKNCDLPAVNSAILILRDKAEIS